MAQLRQSALFLVLTLLLLRMVLTVLRTSSAVSNMLKFAMKTAVLMLLPVSRLRLIKDIMKKEYVLMLLKSVFGLLRDYAQSTDNTVDDVVVDAGINVITAAVAAGEDKESDDATV